MGEKVEDSYGVHESRVSGWMLLGVLGAPWMIATLARIWVRTMGRCDF